MQEANDKSLEKLRDHLLKHLTQRGLPQTMAEFKNSVSNRSEAYRQVVEMEVRYNELQREYLSGQLSKEDESVESNRLTNQFIDLIERLETEPGLLAERRAGGRMNKRWIYWVILALTAVAAGIWFFWPGDNTPSPTAGRVLYKIPPRMEMNQETECIVRIAPVALPESTLSEGVRDTAHKRIEPIRIGDIMTVDLVDEAEAFRVIAKSTKEQLIEANDYTEWKFDVTPTKAGRHELTLKITVRIRLEDSREVLKDVLVLERVVEIVSEPVAEEADLVDGGYLPIAREGRPVDDGTEAPDLPDDELPVGPEPAPEPPEEIPSTPEETPTRGEDPPTDPGADGIKKDREPVVSVKPNKPGKFSLCEPGFRLEPFLESFTADIEERNILYNTEPLSDCSGMFLRLVNALREKCPNALFPDPDRERDSRAIAGWYAEHENLEIVVDPNLLGRKIRPGMVLFYGQQGRSYQKPTLDELRGENGIEHVGVVVGVEKDDRGQVASYTLFHGRSAGKPAGRTTHTRQPSRGDLPPYGNGDQQIVAIALIWTFPQDF